MDLRKSLAATIRTIRKNKGLTQEDFGVVSSRTYLSSLERGLKSPTLDKLEDLAGVLDVHPATIVLMAYALRAQPLDPEDLIEEVSKETKNLCATVK
ncbi:helix-turn-helix domain-containing protein [Azonexus sp.]|uniref:helix-turn-helix domain-containing protein n=1 Tax=Azonexus sp. TaxID=1872668 RepID=UPI0035B37137